MGRHSASTHQTIDKGLAEFSPEAKKDVIRFFKDMRLEKTPRPGPIGAETGGIEPRCGSNLGDRAQLDFSPSGGGVGLRRQRGILAKPSLKKLDAPWKAVDKVNQEGLKNNIENMQGSHDARGAGAARRLRGCFCRGAIPPSRLPPCHLPLYKGGSFSRFLFLVCFVYSLKGQPFRIVLFISCI